MSKNVKAVNDAPSGAEIDLSRIPQWTEFSPEGVKLLEQRAGLVRDQSDNAREIDEISREFAAQSDPAARSNTVKSAVAMLLGREPSVDDQLPLAERWKAATARRDLLVEAIAQLDTEIAMAKRTANGEIMEALKPQLDALLAKHAEAFFALYEIARDCRKVANDLINRECSSGYIELPLGNPLDPYSVWSLYIRRAIERGHLNADEVPASLGGKLK